MRVLIIGAAGMIGRKLGERLAADARLGEAPIEVLALADVIAPPVPRSEAAIEVSVGDVAAPGTLRALIAARPDVIFALAAIVSGEAETDFAKGYRVNLDATRELLEAVRAEGEDYRPRVVFSSSISVFGPPMPDVIDDRYATTPATSYGTQKAIAELLVSDYSRRGFLDGISIRLPTICVRPGAANRAASGFFSSIIREPLNGETATLPVARDVEHWFASPRAAVAFLQHAATLDLARLGTVRQLTMPGVRATVAEQIEALRRVGGDAAVARIHEAPDPLVLRIVSGWSRAFDPRRALELGFVAERDFDEIVRVYIEDELGGRVGGGA